MDNESFEEHNANRLECSDQQNEDIHSENNQEATWNPSPKLSQENFNIHKKTQLKLSTERTPNSKHDIDSTIPVAQTEGNRSFIFSSPSNSSHISPVFIKKSRGIKSSSFASLNEEKKYDLLNNCGSSSLPFVNNYKVGNSVQSSVAVRKHYDDELESSERPFDFSRRYSETRPPKSKCTNENMYKYDKSKDNTENFSIYAETDLDQPTNYSLRYAEDDSDTDSEACDNAVKTPAEFVGDTIKTYCTEGTPYETPLNFSTSTSMSDLRSDKNSNDDNKTAEKHKTEGAVRENSKLQSLCESIEKESQQSHSSKMKSEFSSGLTSPEKPMNYCEEGTPGYFSRVSSIGSLNSNLICIGDEKISEEERCKIKETEEYNKILQKENQNEIKMVKFEDNVNYCEETPLMFSRSSSLGSIDSIEQHSINDDRSSIISDFSRLTSGIISPSELPDSPTQTIPPSPKSQKSSKLININRKSSLNARKSLLKSSIFEDNVTKFKEESTPMQNSITTSLSSLTIDDQDEEILDKSDQIKARNLGAVKKIPQDKNYNGIKNERSPRFVASNSFQVSSEIATTSEIVSPITNDIKISGISRVLPSPSIEDNAPHTYCTEDTPAILSHNGSISDLSLSTLSVLDEENFVNKDFMSDKSTMSSDSEVEEVTTRGKQLAQSENVWQKRSPVSLPNKGTNIDSNFPKYAPSKDETSTYYVEDSPMQFSLRSSLSNLTFESNQTPGTRTKPVSPVMPNVAENNYDFNDSPEKCQNVDEVDNFAEEIPSNDLQESLIVSEIENNATSNFLENHHAPIIESDDVEDPKEGNSTFNDSLRRKKWKWKWKFSSEKSDLVKEEQAFTKPDSAETSRSDHLDDYSKNPDSSKKKKWWKWKFLSKEDDHHGKLSSLDTEAKLAENVEAEAVYFERNHSLKTENQENKNKSKKWKWRWKFSSKEENRSNDVLSSKKSHNSPEFSKEETFIRPSIKKLTRSVSEPRSNRKHSENTTLRYSIKISPSSDISKEENYSNKNIQTGEEHMNNPNESFEYQYHSDDENVDTGNVPNQVESIERNNSHDSDSKLDVSATKLFIKPLSPLVEKTNSTVAMHKAILEECLSKNKNSDENTSKYLVRNQKKSLSNEQEISHLYNTHSEFKKIETNSEKFDEKTSESSDEATCSNQIETNGLEFLKTQLGPEDKRILQEAVNSGISREEEASLVEKLIMGRVTTENDRVKNTLPNNKKNIETYTSKKDVIDNLDPVTLSIIRKILDHRFSKGRRNVSEILKDITLEDTEVYANLNADDCNFEIVLEERIKVTLAKKDGETRSLSEPRDNTRITSFPKKDNETNVTRLVIPHNIENYEDEQRIQEIRQKQINNLRIYQPSFRSDTPQSLTEKPITEEGVEEKVIIASSPVKKTNYAALIEECIQMGMPQKKDLEEAIYANVSISPGYTRSNSLPLRRKPPLKTATAIPKTENSSMARNVQITNDKCSSVGRNKKKIVVHNQDEIERVSLNSLQSNRKNPRGDASLEGQNHAKLLEECIQLGMPNREKPHHALPIVPKYLPEKSEEQETAIYANIPVAPGYSRSSNLLNEFSSKCSSPLLGNNRYEPPKIKAPGNQRKEKPDFSSLIEECIQLGMPVSNKPEINNSKNDLINSDKKLNYEALIEECIQLGMPKKKESSEEAIYANTTERYSTFKPLSNSYSGSPMKKITRSDSEPGCSRIPFANYGNNKLSSTSVTSSLSMDKAIEECIRLGWPKQKEILSVNKTVDLKINNEANSIEHLDTVPKNVNVASVARNMSRFHHVPFRVPAMVTDAEDVSKTLDEARITKKAQGLKKQHQDFLKKNGYDNISVCSGSNIDENISELSFANWGDIELLDPDITLESLDRYTAQLISQAEKRITH